MKCAPTQTPANADIPLLKEKYLQERDKRINREGQKQYRRPIGEFADVYEADPHMPVVPRDPISEDLDVAIVGAGWSGIMAAYHLKNAGVTRFRHIDHAGDFGGVWYWNRYPGLQCDNDAYCYLPLLEETGFMPTKKFADGREIFGYCQQIAKRFGFYQGALFHTLINAMRWDENIKRWRVSTDRGDEIRARFVIMANGLLNTPKLPGVPGIQDFKGRMFHTARWDYKYTGGSYENPVLDKLADKRVAIIGTGASACQAVPYLGRYAKQLYVIQRTPSTVDERPNPPTDPDWVKSLKPNWQKQRQANFHSAAMEFLGPGEPDLICDIWTEISRNLSAELEAENWPQLSFPELMARREAVDYRVMERLRARAQSSVTDPATAEALKPWYRFLCKRPLSNDDFYPTFNRPNVKLIDVSASQGVERMTKNGFVAGGVEYPVDCIIFASGFEVSSDLDRRWGIECGRRPWRQIDLPALVGGSEDAPRGDDAWISQPILRGIHPRGSECDHHRAVRPPGLSHCPCDQRDAEARCKNRRTESGSAGRLCQALRGSDVRQFSIPARMHSQLFHQRRSGEGALGAVPSVWSGMGCVSEAARGLAQ